MLHFVSTNIVACLIIDTASHYYGSLEHLISWAGTITDRELVQMLPIMKGYPRSPGLSASYLSRRTTNRKAQVLQSRATKTTLWILRKLLSGKCFMADPPELFHPFSLHCCQAATAISPTCSMQQITQLSKPAAPLARAQSFTKSMRSEP